MAQHLARDHDTHLVGLAPNGLVDLRSSASGFEGPIRVIDPATAGRRRQRHRRDPARAGGCIDDRAVPPDLAVICGPPSLLPAWASALAALGAGAAIVTTAGLDAGQRRAACAARPKRMYLVGPDSLGVLTHAWAWMPPSPTGTRPGSVAFVSHSATAGERRPG